MNRVGRWAFCIATLVGACAAPPAPVPDGYVFPTHPVANDSPTALLHGTLFERNGCLLVESGQADLLIIWPQSYRLVIGAGGRPVVVTPENRGVAVGQRVEIGGGGTSIIDPDYVERCGGDPYYAGELLNAAPLDI